MVVRCTQERKDPGQLCASASSKVNQFYTKEAHKRVKQHKQPSLHYTVPIYYII